MNRGEIDGEIAAIRLRFLENPFGYRAERALSDLADRAVGDAGPGIQKSEDWAALAVGGYGRGALYPGSDLDILFFATQDPPGPERVAEVVGRFGHIPFPVEADRADAGAFARFDPSRVSIYGAYLDARFLFGHPRVAEDFTGRILTGFVGRHRREFAAALVEAGGATPPASALAEPDLKTAPGAYADTRRIGWIRRIVEVNLLTPGEEDELISAAAKLSALRTALHFASRGRGNVLTRALQPRVAGILGFGTAERPDLARLMTTFRDATAVVRRTTDVIARTVCPTEPGDGEKLPRKR